jgi:hypothetical protein
MTGFLTCALITAGLLISHSPLLWTRRAQRRRRS